MGMFDYIKLKQKLPWDDLDGVEWQTKSLDCQLDNYEIREDGTLWHEEHDVEDHSDPSAEGLLRLAGMLTAVNHRWVPCLETGEVSAHGSRRDSRRYFNAKMWFKDGILKDAVYSSGEYPEPPPLPSEEERQKVRDKADMDQHQRAMELAALADLESDQVEKRSLFIQAAREEDSVAVRTHVEPSCTILTRSAMSLYLQAGDKYEAIGVFRGWLQMQRCCGEPPPKEIVAEIADLLRQIADGL